jgi:hypothetical protein
MSVNKNQEPNNIALSLLVLFLGIAAFYFLSLGIREKPVKKTEFNESSSVKEDRADRNYRELYMKKLRQEMQVDNERVRRDAKKGIPAQGQPQKLDNQAWPDIDAQQEQAHRFDHQKKGEEYDVLTPEDRVQYEIKKRQEEEYATEEARREFIRQLKENAKRDGIEIRVDERTLRAYPVKTNPQ